MSPKRLVLLVEGQGEVEAAPILVDRLLKSYHVNEPVFDAIFLDTTPFRVGGYPKIRSSGRSSKNRQPNFYEWRRLLQVAVTSRRNVGGCLLLLDGDSETTLPGQKFCAAQAAHLLVQEAEKVGAGKLFSLAIVFACMEFESWLIAGVDSLVNKPFSDGRSGIRTLTQPIPSDPEKDPRDAKGWFWKTMTMGYKPTRDQAELTQLVDLNAIRSREMRSFHRLESAIHGLVDAIRSGKHTVTPTL